MARAKAAKPKAAKANVAKAKPRPFDGQRWAFFGELAIWPRYHGGAPAEIAERRGARIVDSVDDADVVVFGDRKGPGRAEARKRAERIATTRALRILDEAAYRELVRIDLTGKRFAFIGGFDCSPTGTEDGLLASMVQRAGGVAQPTVDAALDYLVVGNRRGPSKIALLNAARRLVAEGAAIAELDEPGFMELVRIDTPAARGASPTAAAALDFAGFMSQLYGSVSPAKLGRALDMLRKERIHLYAKLDDDRLVGIVQSQRSSGVYASWLAATGRYGCAQISLDDCMGLQGEPCKHLLVLLIGLARGGQLAMPRALAWMRGAHAHGPSKDKTLSAEAFIQYKGATAGEVDWRPTETLPEDFYAI